jgi:hypothetical protein
VSVPYGFMSVPRRCRVRILRVCVCVCGLGAFARTRIFTTPLSSLARDFRGFSVWTGRTSRADNSMPAAPFRHREHAPGDDEPGGEQMEPAAMPPHDYDDEDGSIEENESDSIEEEDEESPPVYKLRCKACEATLTLRAMQVFLVADVSTSLFSTDIPSSNVREGGEKVIPTCACYARHVHCINCEGAVGYHVRTPCEMCGASDHNGHFWLFEEQYVESQPREDGLRWDGLPYNGADEDGEEVDANGSQPAAMDGSADGGAGGECLVCFASPMWRPTWVAGCPPEHIFCFGCISREVDMRGRCPLDRRPATREDLV